MNQLFNRITKNTEEFRREAVRLMDSSRQPIAQIARDLGVNDSVLYRWRDVYGQTEQSSNGTHGRSVAELEAEVKRLQRENNVLRQERDVLKNWPCRVRHSTR
jgi:transposase